MNELILREALELILNTRPQHGMNPNAMGSDPMDVKIGWNVHWIAREALAQQSVAVELTNEDYGSVWDGHDDEKTGADRLLDMGW